MYHFFILQSSSAAQDLTQVAASTKNVIPTPSNEYGHGTILAQEEQNQSQDGDSAH